MYAAAAWLSIPVRDSDRRSIAFTPVATIGLVPLGLGTFEATAVGLLHALGVGVETAFAATLMLRGLTFWLPMLPGVWLARREVGAPHGAGSL